MKNINRCLLCCDSYEEWMKLKQNVMSDYLIAVNKYSFYKELKEQEERVVFLETNERNPYEAIWKILDQIHNIVDDGRTVDKFLRLFHLSYNVEGGFPTKISQMLINLNLISNIVKDNDIQEIYFFDNVHNWIINECIYLYATSGRIKCHVMDPSTKEKKAGLKTLTDMEGKIIDFSDETLMRKEAEKLKKISEKPKKKHVKETTGSKEEVGILYCPDFLYKKHVDWVMRKVEAIGYDTKVICYYDTEAVSEFRKRGLQADCMEEYFEKKDFFDAYEILKLERTEILNRLARQLKVSYRDTDLSKWLLIKIRNHYYRELLNYLYMEICAGNYFKQHKFTFIHAWGDSEFWQTWVCYDNTRDNNSILFKIECSSFITSKLKLQFPKMIPVVFSPNIEQKYQTFVTEYPRKVFSICDPFWGKQGSGKQYLSRRQKNRIGIFPTGVMKGFTTYQFYYGTWMPLVDLLLNLGYKIVFKNHPAIRECWEEDMEVKYNEHDSVTMFTANESIDKVLGCCDIVITDISSVAFDAALLQKPVFCIVDKPGFDMIRQHASGFSIYQSTKDLLKEVESVSKNNERYKAVLDKQNSYMEVITRSKDRGNQESVYALLKSVK